MSDGWTLEVPAYGVTFIAERLRRERHELIGELTVKCLLPGAKTVGDHLLSVADFNFSGLRSRQDRAKHLAERAQTNGKIDWYGLLEELCQGVFERERRGGPAINIWDVELDETVADDFAIDGIAFPRKLPSILFGDGGSLKSYLALYLAGRLAQQGLNVGYFDWELEPAQHRKRFGFLFGTVMPRPQLKYVHCDNPLTSELDRLVRIIKENQLHYAIFDSISFAVDGRAEDHETVLRYSRCCRQMGIGSLHIAHTNRSEEADRKPFGSSFWHNSARSTWFAKAEPIGPGTLSLGVHHRKANCGPLRQSVAFRVSFSDLATKFTKINVSEAPDVSAEMKVWQRIEALLETAGRSMTCLEISEELDEKPDTVRKAAKRKNHLFHLLGGGTGEQDRITLVKAR